MVLRIGEHRHLVLVALAWDFRNARHKCRGDATKPRLRVAHHEPRHQEEEPARPPVSETTPKRDLPRKRTDAENEPVAVAAETIRYLRYVLGRVLPVGVGSYYVCRVPNVRKARLQRGAFAAVLFVYENDVDERGRLFKHVLARHRAVIDKDDMLEALLQLREEHKQLLVRIVRRNEYCKRKHYSAVPHLPPSLTAFARAWRRM